MLPPLLDGVYLLVVLTVVLASSVRAYPYVERKADPFMALANTLRQQERLEEQRYGRSGAALDGGYYYDYGREVPSDDDLWQMEQIQRQLGRAARVPFFGRAQRKLGGAAAEEYRIPTADRDDGLLEVDGPEEGGEWYDAIADLQQQQQGYDPRELAEEQERERQEGRLLLDTLAEYMSMYGGDAPTAPEEAKRTGPGAEKAEPGDDVDTTTGAPAQQHHQEKQPPVQRSGDGTPLGQKEFPMMRPATPSRQQWWGSHVQDDTAPAPSQEFDSKRHSKTKNFLQKPIATSEDELIQELDNLKTKKN